MQNIEKQYAQTFATFAGKQVLAHLRSITIERIIGPNVSNEDLRWWAAQNALSQHIENLVKKGNNLK